MSFGMIATLSAGSRMVKSPAYAPFGNSFTLSNMFDNYTFSSSNTSVTTYTATMADNSTYPVAVFSSTVTGSSSIPNGTYQVCASSCSGEGGSTFATVTTGAYQLFNTSTNSTKNYYASGSMNSREAVNSSTFFSSNTTTFSGYNVVPYTQASPALYNTGTGGLSTVYQVKTTGGAHSSLGEWIQIKIPDGVRMKITQFVLTDRTNTAQRIPYIIDLYCSNDGNTWVYINTYTNSAGNSASSFTQSVSMTTYYNYARFVMTELNGFSSNPSPVNINNMTITATD